MIPLLLALAAASGSGAPVAAGSPAPVLGAVAWRDLRWGMNSKEAIAAVRRVEGIRSVARDPRMPWLWHIRLQKCSATDVFPLFDPDKSVMCHPEWRRGRSRVGGLDSFSLWFENDSLYKIEFDVADSSSRAERDSAMDNLERIAAKHGRSCTAFGCPFRYREIGHRHEPGTRTAWNGQFSLRLWFTREDVTTGLSH